MTSQEGLNIIMRAWKNKTEGEISYSEFDQIYNNTMNQLNDTVKHQVIGNLQSLGMLSK